MTTVEIVIMALILAGSATTLFTLFSHCKSEEKKSLEMNEIKTSSMDKEA